MTSKERMSAAMNLLQPDKVPLMCQLSIGHYFLNSKISPEDIWLTPEGFADALIELAFKYNFDGILINLPGREADYQKHIEKIERGNEKIKITWKNGCYTIIPGDDNPHYYLSNGSRCFPSFDEIKPDDLFYIEPWDVTGISYPCRWGFEEEVRAKTNFFPDYISGTIKLVKQKASGLSIHSEVFSPWSQFLELLNCENALIAVMDDPAKVKACLERLTEGAIALSKIHAKENVDAILISSAFAGAGLISREDYINFVLPYEKKIIDEIKKEFNIPVYIHTCGSIGDRMDLMLETGTNGIDTLDPPPLGTVELDEAKKFLNGKAFIKGNIDPVNTLLLGNKEIIKKDVEWRLNTAKQSGGYILSTACSVAPSTPPDNIMLLSKLRDEFGKY